MGTISAILVLQRLPEEISRAFLILVVSEDKSLCGVISHPISQHQVIFYSIQRSCLSMRFFSFLLFSGQRDDEQIATALGYAVHVLVLISKYLDVSTCYKFNARFHGFLSVYLVLSHIVYSDYFTVLCADNSAVSFGIQL